MPRHVEPAVSAPRATGDFFAHDPVTMAKLLIGQRLVRILDDGTRLAGTIVETEAYLGVKDAAAHSFGGRRTPRNEAMYRAPGTLYVYFTYGMHHCMNVVCGAEDEPVAVLLRAMEPTEGLERMRELRLKSRRGGAGNLRKGSGAHALPPEATTPAAPIPTADPAPGPSPPVSARTQPVLRDQDLCSGPARLCQALAIDRQHNLIDLTTDSRLWIEVLRTGVPPRGALMKTSRVGVGYAGPWAIKPLRWFLRSSIHVSRSSPS